MIAALMALTLTNSAQLMDRVNMQLVGKEVLRVVGIESLAHVRIAFSSFRDPETIGREIVSSLDAGVPASDCYPKNCARGIGIVPIPNEKRKQLGFSFLSWKNVGPTRPKRRAVVPLVNCLSACGGAEQFLLAARANLGYGSSKVGASYRAFDFNQPRPNDNFTHDEFLGNPRSLIGLGNLSVVLEGLSRNSKVFVVSVGAVPSSNPGHTSKADRSSQADQAKEAERSLPDADAYRLLASYDRSYSDDVSAALFVGIGGALLGGLLGFGLFRLGAHDVARAKRQDSHEEKNGAAPD